jgi:hypothetical protein
MNKNYNNLLFLGLFIVVVGIFLFIYSFSSYMEVKNLSEKIDFDDLDNNNYVSTNDRYYKHLSIGEFLNAKLEKNKKLPVKHTACVYLDYAQHNVLSEYKLIFNSSDLEDPRKDVVEANIKSLNEMLNNYASCKNAATYKDELKMTLEKIEKSVDLYESAQQRMDNFLNGGGEIERVEGIPEYNELEPAPQENAPQSQEPAIPQVIEEGNTY